jgi:4-deoxy-L-threo-5-hexosulose-uronate ketol-isomerase
MTKYEIRYASHPEDVVKYGTEELRKKFLIENLFEDDNVLLVYSMYDRYIIGGIKPVNSIVNLETIDALKSKYFLERRELGIVNVGAEGCVHVDGERYTLQYKEALYIGRGNKEIQFESTTDEAALFYINSAAAHRAYPIKKITKAESIIIELGDDLHANKRTLNKLIVNDTVETCQLQLGMTELHPGHVWNTMPSHTHTRRMEAYFYFEIKELQTVSHFMGEPQNTRHLFMQNNQAVISPEWSIHSGVGTANYTFIWGMAGENLDYSDMDGFTADQLR